MEQIDNLKELINQGDVDTAIKQLDQLLCSECLLSDFLHAGKRTTGGFLS